MIEIEQGVPCLTPRKPNTTTPSQAVFRVEATEKPETLWLTESPEPKLERVVDVKWVSDIDKEFRRFFTKQSLQRDGLLHQEYRSLKTVIRVPRKEVGSVETTDLQARLLMPSNSELLIDETLQHEDKFAFIYRAKYRA